MERFKPVKGYPRYSISNLGRVFVNKTQKELKPDKTGVNTLGRVFLTNEKGRKTLGISTLMKDNWTWEWLKYIDDGEEFTEITNSPGYYISNRGRVWSMITYSFQTPVPSHSYYWSVRTGGRKSPQIPLHTLVGRHFIPEYRDGLWILHRDEELPFPQINYVENLFVGTLTDNNRDTFNKGRQPDTKGRPCMNPWGRRGKPTDT